VACLGLSSPSSTYSVCLSPLVPAADICTVIVDKPHKATLLLEHVERKETPGLKLVILMEPFEDALRERGKKCGVDIKSMQAIEVRVYM
jgi:long-chain acyl-CoA synthetase